MNNLTLVTFDAIELFNQMVHFYKYFCLTSSGRKDEIIEFLHTSTISSFVMLSALAVS